MSAGGNPGDLFLTAHRKTGAVSTLGAGSNLTDPHIHPKLTRLSVMVTLMPVPKNERLAGVSRLDRVDGRLRVSLFQNLFPIALSRNGQSETEKRERPCLTNGRYWEPGSPA